MRWPVSVKVADDALRPAGRLLIHPRRNLTPTPCALSHVDVACACPAFMTLISALTGLSLQKQAGHRSVDEKIKSLFKQTCFHLVRLLSPGILEVYKPPNQPSKVEKERWLTVGGHRLFIIAKKKKKKL